MSSKSPRELWPSEVRAKVIAQHDKLRAYAKTIDEKLNAGINDESDREELLESMTVMTEWLLHHMDFEEQNLLRALKEADAWGDIREGDFKKHHDEQRQEIHEIIGKLRSKDANPTKAVRGFLHNLRQEMDDEESRFLDPDVLRDDVVSTDAVGS